MASKAEEFQKHAAECEQRAREARDPQAQKDFAEAARCWRAMAEQAERMRR
jgi:hypothetical protein